MIGSGIFLFVVGLGILITSLLTDDMDWGGTVSMMFGKLLGGTLVIVGVLLVGLRLLGVA